MWGINHMLYFLPKLNKCLHKFQTFSVMRMYFSPVYPVYLCWELWWPDVKRSIAGELIPFTGTLIDFRELSSVWMFLTKHLCWVGRLCEQVGRGQSTRARRGAEAPLTPSLNTEGPLGREINLLWKRGSFVLTSWAPPPPSSTLPQLLHLISFQEAEIEQMGLLWSAALTDTDVIAFVSWERAELSIVIKDLGFPWQG